MAVVCVVCGIVAGNAGEAVLYVVRLVVPPVMVMPLLVCVVLGVGGANTAFL